MKIPKLKIPSLKKLPKLPKIPGLSKLPKLSALPLVSKFLKKKKDDDEDDDDFDDDFGSDSAPDSKSDSLPPPKGPDGLADGKDAGGGEEGTEGGEDAAPAPVDAGDDIDSGDDDFDDDDEDDEGHRKHLIIAAAGAFVLLAGVAGGAGWWYFGAGDKAAAKPTAQVKGPARGPRVQMALPPKPGTRGRGGGLNQLSQSLSKGIMTPRAPGAATSGATPANQTAKGPPANQAAKEPAAGQTVSYARTVGDIGGRFGGRANPLGGSLNALGGEVQGKGAGIVVPAVTTVTLRTLPDNPGGKPLGATPDVRLIEKKEGLTGSLPIIGKDGAMPRQVYFRPYEGDDEGMRVAIVIIGLGLSRAASMAAIGKLPPEVTLALDPYALDLSDWLVRARLVGHEVMMTLPMESERFPVHDAGPYSLDTGLKEEENIKRLELVLSQVTGYFGVATVLGSRFGTSKALLRPVLEALKNRGLMVLSTGVQGSLLAPKIGKEIGLTQAVSDMTLDDEPSRAAVEAKLLRLEGLIKERNFAIAVAHPYPSTIARLIPWMKKLKEKKITLVPLSALAGKQASE